MPGLSYDLGPIRLGDDDPAETPPPEQAACVPHHGVGDDMPAGGMRIPLPGPDREERRGGD